MILFLILNVQMRRPFPTKNMRNESACRHIPTQNAKPDMGSELHFTPKKLTVEARHMIEIWN